MTKQYTVTWAIEIDADSPEDAVKRVHDEFFKLGNDATVFDVWEFDSPEDTRMIDAADVSEDI